MVINSNTFRNKTWLLPVCDDHDLTTALKMTGRSQLLQMEPESVENMINGAAFVERMLEIVRERRKVGIFGDYDADGICSTVMWLEFFAEFGVPCCYYTPSRKDGYGPSRKGVDFLLVEGSKVLLFLDCGTNSTILDEIETPCLVLDHHEILTPIKNHPITNSRLAKIGDFSTFCTAGLSFIMIQALLKKLNLEQRPFLSKIVDLACIGTVGDVMPVTDCYNKTIIKAGLRAMSREGGRSCISLLLKNRAPNYESVAFSIVPLINAPGRIHTLDIAIAEQEEREIAMALGVLVGRGGRIFSSDIAIKALMERDFEKAAGFVNRLLEINDKRQKMEQIILSQALIQADENEERDVFVVKNSTWNLGLVGIVAGRIKEKTGKTTFALCHCVEDRVWKGSARGDNVSEIIAGAVKLGLCTGGGHPAAGGVTVPEEKLDSWLNYIHSLRPKKPDLVLVITAICREEQLMVGFGDLAPFAPFGPGNPKPLVLFRGLRFSKITPIKERHLRLITTERVALWAFNIQNWRKQPEIGKTYDVVISVDELGNKYVEDVRESVFS